MELLHFFLSALRRFHSYKYTVGRLLMLGRSQSQFSLHLLKQWRVCWISIWWDIWNHETYCVTGSMAFVGVPLRVAFLSEKWCRTIHHFDERKDVALDISEACDRVRYGALLSKPTAFRVDVNFSRASSGIPL